MNSRIPPIEHFTAEERRLLRVLGTPLQVQHHLRTVSYNGGKAGDTQRTFRGVVQHRRAHCLEAVFFTATILERRGYPPIVLDIESEDGLDHVLFLYKRDGKWGTVARSRDFGLHGRRPIFETVEQLVESYFDPYVDGSGRVIGYGTAHLDELARSDWRLATHNVWAMERALINMPHRRVRMSQARYADMLQRFQQYKEQGGGATRAAMRALYGQQVALWL
ncbi:MAG: hypothetical protein ABIT38_22255 [Gemmatimonadaceae bacterium]